jgi:hypothetical protein
MLRIDKVQTIEGVTVIGDSDPDSFETHYLISNSARFRRDENGNFVLKVLKYRTPKPRPDGSLGGGYAIFDVEFVVPEEKQARIVEVLQQQVNEEAARRGVSPPSVIIGSPIYTRGTAHLNLSDKDGFLIEEIKEAGKPSLYENNVSTYSLELTQAGATTFEQALQGKGGFVSVVYDLWFWAKLPPLKVTASFDASAFYSFFQDVDIEWNDWGEDDYRETIREMMIESESSKIEIDSGGVTDQKIIDQVTAWATRALEEAIERRMIESIQPVSEEDREVPEGIDNLTRDIMTTKVSSFKLEYTQDSTVEWNIAPQGVLPNITSLLDGQGNPVRWEDYMQLIDLKDKFFQQLNVAVFVSADFENLPLNSVEVKLDYNGEPMDPGEVRLASPNEVGHFAEFIADDNWNYKYSYQINYTGESRIFQSEPVETNESTLTIGVGDTGILDVQIAPGDLNFDQVNQAIVTLRYEDSDLGIGPLEQQFTLTADSRAHRFQEVIFEPVRRPYEYKVKYFLENNMELESDWNKGRSPHLFIQDPFSNLKTVNVRAVGDLQNEIENIFLDLKYVEAGNVYTQELSTALNKSNPFFDWTFPVIKAEGSQVMYSGMIEYQDPNRAVEPIEPTVATENTIIVPKIEDILQIQILADLLDFSQIKLCKVSLSYLGDDSETPERKDFIFTPVKTAMQTWTLKVKDKSKQTYGWTAEFFMEDLSKRIVEVAQATELTIILELPAVEPAPVP